MSNFDSQKWNMASFCRQIKSLSERCIKLQWKLMGMTVIEWPKYWFIDHELVFIVESSMFINDSSTHGHYQIKYFINNSWYIFHVSVFGHDLLVSRQRIVTALKWVFILKKFWFCLHAFKYYQRVRDEEPDRSWV